MSDRDGHEFPLRTIKMSSRPPENLDKFETVVNFIMRGLLPRPSEGMGLQERVTVGITNSLDGDVIIFNLPHGRERP